MKYLFVISLTIISVITGFFAFSSLSNLAFIFYPMGLPWSREIGLITSHFSYRNEVVGFVAKNSYILGSILNVYIFYWLGKSFEIFWERKQYFGMLALIIIFIGISFGMIFSTLDKYVIDFLASIAKLF